MIPTKIKANKITEVAIVVNDLQKTMETYWNLLGIGPWKLYMFAPPALKETTLRGKAVSYSMKLASTTAGVLQIELVQPLDGPSIYKEFLEKRGEGLHHIGCYQYETSDQINEALEKFKSIGIGVLMSGKVFDTEYYYMDTEKVLGLLLELVKPGKEPQVGEFPQRECERNLKDRKN